MQTTVTFNALVTVYSNHAQVDIYLMPRSLIASCGITHGNSSDPTRTATRYALGTRRVSAAECDARGGGVALRDSPST